MACHGGASNDEIKRHKDIGATCGAVHEIGVQRNMPPANLNTGMVAWNQRTGNAQIFLVTQETIGVIQTKGKTQNAADRRQRDVTLVPGDAHTQDFLSLPGAFAHDTVIRNGRSVRTCPWAG